MSEQIEIEVAYATPEKQKIVRLWVNPGTSVLDAALQSGIEQYFPGLQVASLPMGIWGKRVAKPEAQSIQAGERIELYRPLLIDPKAARANRAKKLAKEQQADENRTKT